MDKNVWKRLFEWPFLYSRSEGEAEQTETPTENVSITVSDTLTVKENSTVHHNQIQRLAVSKPDITKKTRVAVKRGKKTSRRKTSTTTTTTTIDSDCEWKEHPEAWGLLQDSNQVEHYLINCQTLEDERKGYLIGSDSSCDLVIKDNRIQPRHCLIYVENFTSLDNTCTIRVFLKDIRNLSEVKCSTLLSVNGVVVQKESKEPVCLQDSDRIRFISPNDKIPRFFRYRLYLRPDIIAKKFQDEFTLGTLIGRGTFSDVYIATMNHREPTQPEYYVVKIINKNLFKHQPKSLQAFEQEISVLMLLQKHPGIVNVVKVYDSTKEYHIIMDYIAEGDLFSHIINCGSLNEASAKIIFKQLFNTIKYLHDVGVVHRDIKPENIMMANKVELQVKLCDFGLASLQRDNLSTRCGTEQYVAPEVLSIQDKDKWIDQITSKDPAKAYGKECDLWSLGVVLHVCLCGDIPFNSGGSKSVGDRILATRYQINTTGWERISTNAKLLIRGLLTVDRKKRLTADEALNHPWFNHEEKSV